MSRPSRMLVLVAIFAVAAVVVLAMMARHYGQILDRRQGSTRIDRPAEPTATPEAPAEAEQALVQVDAFIDVHRALAQGAASDLPVSLQRALDEAGLERADFADIGKLYRAWKAGREDIDGSFAAAFEQRRSELEQLEL